MWQDRDRDWCVYVAYTDVRLCVCVFERSLAFCSRERSSSKNALCNGTNYTIHQQSSYTHTVSDLSVYEVKIALTETTICVSVCVRAVKTIHIQL